MKRTTIFLPEDLHEELREEAFRSRVSMAQLIRARLEQGRARRSRRSKDLVLDDPLLKVAGIIHDGTLTRNLDEELYEI